MTKADFVRAARVIHTFGEPQKLYKYTRIYLVHAGWKYWTMDREHDDVTLINRSRADHVYGVQNMPHTKSDFRTGYDSIATYWDSRFAASRGLVRKHPLVARVEHWAQASAPKMSAVLLVLFSASRFKARLTKRPFVKVKCRTP